MIKTISNINPSIPLRMTLSEVERVKNQILKIFKKINMAFIKVILFLFYFLILGLISALYKLFKKKQGKTKSYWQDYSAKELELDFKSPY